MTIDTTDPEFLDFVEKVRTGKLETWSCDPASIQEWTEEGKQRLHAALADIFGWEKVDETERQDRRDDEGTVPNLG